MEKKERMKNDIEKLKLKRDDADRTISAINEIVKSNKCSKSKLTFLCMFISRENKRKKKYNEKIRILEEGLKRREKTGILQYEGRYNWSKRD